MQKKFILIVHHCPANRTNRIGVLYAIERLIFFCPYSEKALGNHVDEEDKGVTKCDPLKDKGGF